MISKIITEAKIYKTKSIDEVHFTSCFPWLKYLSSYVPCQIICNSFTPDFFFPFYFCFWKTHSTSNSQGIKLHCSTCLND